MCKTIELTIDLTRRGIVSITTETNTNNEQAVVALSDDGMTVVAAGKEAGKFFRIAYPLDGSVVVDPGRTEEMFRIFLRNAVGKTTCFTKIKATVIVRLPLSMIELKALHDSLEHAGVNALQFICVDQNGQASPWLS